MLTFVRSDDTQRAREIMHRLLKSHLINARHNQQREDAVVFISSPLYKEAMSALLQ